jgi:hypothetical protein
MSRLLIVQLVSELLRRGLASRSHVLYTEALSYPPSKEEVVTRLDAQSDVLGILNFISSGVFGIQVVPELSTVAMQGQPIRMVVFPSFNPSQLAAVCSEIPAAAVTIVNGVPPKDSNRWRTDAIRSLNNVESIAGRDEVNTSTFDYRETLQLLLRIYQEHGTDEKIVISPTGSKMQSVAVGIICGLMSDIQIVYPTPRMFPSPTNYTEGAGQSYQLPLGVFAGV